MDTTNTTNNKLYQAESSQELVGGNTQTQYLTKKIAKLNGNNIDFKTITNRNTRQNYSITKRIIKKCNSLFNNNDSICGIVYYSKKDSINLNCRISDDGTLHSKVNCLWTMLFNQVDFEQRFACVHFAIAWATNELNIKNINDLLELKNSNFFTKFAGEEICLPQILNFYRIVCEYSIDIFNTYTMKCSPNNLGKTLYEKCKDMHQNQTRTYLFATTGHFNIGHCMALKVITKNNAVQIKFYDPNDTLREQHVVFNSIDDMCNLKAKDLLRLSLLIAYSAISNKKNCYLLYIPEGYSIEQDETITNHIDSYNSISDSYN